MFYLRQRLLVPFLDLGYRFVEAAVGAFVGYLEHLLFEVSVLSCHDHGGLAQGFELYCASILKVIETGDGFASTIGQITRLFHALDVSFLGFSLQFFNY